jgi:tetratricopeptide (TPR) repeat protein
LLDEAEQRLFRRISVFVGGCTFEAAEAVADTKHDLGVDIIDGIESLVNKSMIQLGDQLDSEVRVTIMETVREYGLERLTQSGEDAHVRKAHAAYFLVLAEEAAAALEGPDQPIWLERLDRDRDNVRAALEWLRTTRNASWGLRLATALLRYWEVREHFAEGRRWLAAMLALPTASASSPARAKAAFAAAVLAGGQRDYRGQEPFLTESMRIYRELGDRRGAAIVLNAMAVGGKNVGEAARARELFEEALALWVEIDDVPMRARTLSNLATILKETGQVDEALARHEEAQALFQQLGDEVGVAWELRHQGDIARDRHDRARAESLYQQSLSAFQSMGDAWSTGSLLIDLGNLALSVGEVAKGVDYFREAAEAFQHLGGHKRGLARVIEGLAVAASLEGDAGRAIRLAGAAAALRAASGTPLTSTEQRLLTTGLEAANAALSADERSKAWSEGWSMPAERALAHGTGAVS